MSYIPLSDSDSESETPGASLPSYHQTGQAVTPFNSSRPELPPSTSYLTHHRRTSSVKAAAKMPSLQATPSAAENEKKDRKRLHDAWDDLDDNVGMLQIRKRRELNVGERKLLDERLAEVQQQCAIAALELDIYEAAKDAEKDKRMDPAEKQESVDYMWKELQALPGYAKEHSLLEQLMPHSVLIQPETAVKALALETFNSDTESEIFEKEFSLAAALELGAASKASVRTAEKGVGIIIEQQKESLPNRRAEDDDPPSQSAQ